MLVFPHVFQGGVWNMIGALENVHIDDTRDNSVYGIPITNTLVGRFHLVQIYPHYDLHICKMVPKRMGRLNRVWNGEEV